MELVDCYSRKDGGITSESEDRFTMNYDGPRPRVMDVEEHLLNSSWIGGSNESNCKETDRCNCNGKDRKEEDSSASVTISRVSATPLSVIVS